MIRIADANAKKWILISFLLLMVIHVIFSFSGMYGNDDINYARYAADIAYNGISFGKAADHFQLRWGLLYPTALAYKFFGINSFTSALCSLLSVFICGILLYKILRNAKPGIYLFALLLFFFGHSIIFYMHRLLPDLIMCFAIFWMYFIYRSASELKSWRETWQGLLFSVALFLAVITKETIIIVLPLFVFFFIRDIIKKQRLLFWKYSAMGCIIFIALYLLYFKLSTGDFLYRYHVLQANNYFSECSFDSFPFVETIKRVGYKLWNAMILNGDFIILLPGIAAFIYRESLATYTGFKKQDAIAFLILLACSNFMSISAVSYIPLCHDPRHFLFLMPFAAITGGPMLYAYLKAPTKFIMLPLLFCFATAIAFAIHAGTTKYLYLLVSLLFILRYLIFIFSKKRIYFLLSGVAFAILLSINYLVDIVKPMYPYYWNHKKIIQNNFAGKTTSATVFTSDGFTAELSEYFLAFKKGGIKFLPMDSVKDKNTGILYYLLNGELTNNEKMKIDSISKINSSVQFVLLDSQPNISLYKIDHSILQVLKKNKPGLKTNE